LAGHRGRFSRQEFQKTNLTLARRLIEIPTWPDIGGGDANYAAPRANLSRPAVV